MSAKGQAKAVPRRVAGFFWRRLPWYGKLLYPFVALAMLLYAADMVAGWFV